MAEDLVSIGIAYDTSQLVAGSRQVQTAMQQLTQAERQTQTASEQLANSSTKTAQALGQEGQAAQQATAQLGQQASTASGALATMAQQAIAFGAGQAGIMGVAAAFAMVSDAVSSAVQAAMRLESLTAAMQAITGSAQGASQELAFVRTKANRLGLDFKTLAGSYKGLAAAGRGTSLEGEEIRKTFLGIVEAGRSLGLSNQEVQGALMAMGQMMSKGTVQAEELRGQLGERLPGAFQIAARAMGVSTAELGKMLEKGEVLTADFLPRFNRQIRAELGGASAEAAQTAGAALNRLGNTVGELSTAVGQKLTPALATAVDWFNKVARASLLASEDVLKANEAIA